MSTKILTSFIVGEELDGGGIIFEKKDDNYNIKIVEIEYGKDSKMNITSAPVLYERTFSLVELFIGIKFMLWLEKYTTYFWADKIREKIYISLDNQ